MGAPALAPRLARWLAPLWLGLAALAAPAPAQQAAAPAAPAVPAAAPETAAPALPAPEAPASAAEISAATPDDRGFITRLLEENLSTAGRRVTIEGFRGALSSRATFDRLTIADDQGVWLTIRDGALQWDRSALLRRRIDIAELAAAQIDLPRLPATGEPARRAETRGFSLPQLPVALNIDRIDVARVEIGAPVFGAAAAVAVEGGLALAGGEGTARLAVERVDGRRGSFAIDTAFSNATTVLKVDVTLDEAADGIFANLVGLEGRPAVKAEIRGEGPLKEFAADIRLATDGTERVTGTVGMTAAPGADGSPGTSFRARLGGDVAALLPEDQRAFFGSQAQLLAQGWRGDDGRLDIPVLLVDTEALNLSGSFATNALGAPVNAVLLLTLGEDAGAGTLPVRLPLRGEPTTVQSGRLQLSYDAAEGDRWTLRGHLGGFTQEGLALEAVDLDGSGTVELVDEALRRVAGTVSFDAAGIAPADPGLAAAIGPKLSGNTGFDWTPGNAADLTDLAIASDQFGLEGELRADGLSSGIVLSGTLAGRYGDLSQLAALLGQRIAGAADGTMSGHYRLLDGSFDGELALTGRDLSVGQPQLDKLLSGDATVTASARRDETGIELRELKVNGARLTASAAGALNSAATDLRARVELPSLADVDPALKGSLAADAALAGPAGARRLTLNGAAVDLATGIAALDGALKGRTALTVAAGEADGRFRLDRLELANPQLSLEGSGDLTPGSMDATLSLAVPDLARLSPGWRGRLSAGGRVTEADGARRLTLDGTGAGLGTGIPELDAALAGTSRFSLDATQRGAAIEIGKLAVENDQLTASVSGPVGLAGTRLTGEAELKSLAVLGRGWEGGVTATGSFTDLGGGRRRLAASGTGRGLAFGQRDLDALLAGETRFSLDAVAAAGAFEIASLTAENPRLTASASGVLGGGRTDLTGRARLASLAELGRGWQGAVTAEGRVTEDGQGGRRIAVTGTGENLALGNAQVDGALTGTTRFTLTGTERAGTLAIDTAEVTNDQARITAKGSVGATTDLTGEAAIARLEALGLGWRGSVNLAGSFADDGKGNRRVDVTGTGEGLALGQQVVDGALTGTTQLALKATQTPQGFVIEDGRLTNDQAEITAAGRVGPEGTDLTGRARIRTLAALGLGWKGAVDLAGSFRDAGDGTRRLDVSGTTQDVAIGRPEVDGLLRGTSQVAIRAAERAGVFTIEEGRVENAQGSVTATGTYGGGATDLSAKLSLPSLAVIGPGWRGAVAADATLREDGSGTRAFTLAGTGSNLSLGQTQLDAALAGDTRFRIAGTEREGVVTLSEARIDNPRLTADVTGRLGGGTTDLSGRVEAASIAFLGRGLRGGISAEGRVVQEGDRLAIAASGEARGLGLGEPRIDALLAGNTRFDVAATRRGQALTIDRLNLRGAQLNATASGSLDGGITLDARLSDVALLAPGFSGPAQARGTVRRAGAGQVGLDLDVSAPGGTRARVAGTVAQNGGTADLRISGVSDAALANPFLRVRSIEGPVNFDLRLNGKPSLEALTGRVSLPSARLSDPKLGVRIEGLALTADIGGGGLQVQGGGRLADGGNIAVSGRIGLAGSRAVDLSVRLDGAVLRDPNLYQTSATGTLAVSGDLAAGPLISGRLSLGRTEIRIPSTGLGGAKDIPEIKHVNDRPPVRATRAKAGLTPYPGAESRAAGLAGPPATPPAVVARLDITLDAPNQVFVRGRGVDAELGGTIRLTGSARKVVPIGYLELIRGRVDLLGRRFALTEGLVELQGSLIPVLRLVAETDRDGITTRIIIEGEANDPTITFASVPEMPQEEVLSQMLFGRGIENISALQAAQLANAVAVLAGRGGEGIVSQLRNQIGLDDLDLSTDDSGNVSVRAGKYLSEKVYTDVSVGGDGKTRLNLNLDVTDALTARGTVTSDGESSLGLFYEKDY